ncbi:NAD-dependent epimerase/dehydratase family protein [Marinomonas epiphytica]
MANILIAGCGDIGSRLASELVCAGHQVVGIRKTGTHFPQGVVGITGELTELDYGCLPDVDIVYLILTPQGRNQASYEQTYLQSAQAMVNRYAKEAKLPQMVFVSSTSVYGQHQGEWVDESTTAQAISDTAKVLLATELLLSSHFPSIAVRCSGIYGPGRFRLLDKICSQVEWGENSWTNRVHRDDVVSALSLLTSLWENKTELPEHIIVTDSTPVTMWEVKLWLSKKLQVEANLGDQSYLPTSGKRLQASFLSQQGWQPVYPSYTSGYQSLVSEYLRIKKEAR